MKMHGQLKQKGASGAKPQQATYELKHHVVLALNKLADRDTYQLGAKELEKTAESLPPEGIVPFLSCILVTDSEQKSTVRKECIRIMGVLAKVHDSLIGPHLGKMIASIVKRLKDPDSIIRETCVQTMGVLALNVGNHQIEQEGVFSALVKPFFEALGEQNKHVQSGAALCLAAVIDNVNDPPASVLQRMLTRINKLLKNTHFMAKSALIELVRSLILAGGASSRSALSTALGSLSEALRNADWSTRKSAALALAEIGSSGSIFLAPFKASCINSLESCRFDKVKPVRDAVLQSLQCWKIIPEPDMPEPSETGSLMKENLSTTGSMWKDALLVESDVSMSKQSSVAMCKAGQHNAGKLSQPKSRAWTEVVPKGFNGTSQEQCNGIPEASSVTKMLRTKTSGDTNMRELRHDYTVIDDTQEYSSASNHIFDNVSSKYMGVSDCSSDGEGKTKPISLRKPFEADRQGGETCLSLSKMHDERSPSSIVTDLEESHTTHVCCPQTEKEICSIRNQLLEIQKKQSSLFDLLQDFTVSTTESLSVIQTKVFRLEYAVEQIADGLVHSRNCVDLTGATSMMKNTGVVSPRFSTCTPRSSVDVHDRHSTILPVRNREYREKKLFGDPRVLSSVSQKVDSYSYTPSNRSRNLTGKRVDKSPRHRVQDITCRQTKNPDIIFASPSYDTRSKNGRPCIVDPWNRVVSFLHKGDLDSAYTEALCSEDEFVLIELLNRTGPVLEILSKQTISDLLNTLMSRFLEDRYTNLTVPWLQQIMELTALHGPNCIPLSSKSRQEMLYAMRESLNADTLQPAERRVMIQLATELRQLWGEAIF